MFSPGFFFGAGSQDDGAGGRARARLAGDAAGGAQAATQVDRPVMLGERVYAAYFEDSSASAGASGAPGADGGARRRETPTAAYVSYLHRLAGACGRMFEAGSVLFVNIGRPAHSVRGLNGTSMNVYDEVIGSGNILWFEIDSAWFNPQGPAVLPLEKCFSSCKVCMNWLSLQTSAAQQSGEANSNVIVLHTRGNNLHGNNGGAGASSGPIPHGRRRRPEPTRRHLRRPR